MAKITSLPVIRALGIMLIVLWSLGMKAQTAHNPVLTWDQEVGCIDYDDRGEKDYYTLIEQISMGVCLRVCEESTVTYGFTANGVTDVQWQVNGGNLQSSSNTGATIHWNSGGNGSLTLTITYDDNTVDVLTVCVEKVISPEAYFEIDGPEPHQKEFCTFLPISFNNLSNDNGGSAIVNYLWDFGDGTTSSLFEPTHAYDHPGTYTVELAVTNSCNCTSYYKWEVNVMDAREFEITCPSVVCENARETYSVTDGCGGEWKVIGGTMIANNGTSIEVVWDNVDPQEGFGYVSYRSNCSCPIWTTVKIPVVLRRGLIKGPGVVCQDSQGRFTLPQWPATEFEWMIDGDPNHPMLVHTDQRNEIVVDGATPGAYVLSVQYTNTLIDDGKCMGKAEIKFSVAERPQIITDDDLTNCQNNTMSFQTHNGVSVEWQIMLDGNIVYTHTGSTMDYDFPDSGTHVITVGYDGCDSDPVMVEVVELPVMTGTIDGPEKVCLNTPYTYTLSEEEPGFIYVWSVTNGAVIGDNTGAQADVQFTGSPATVSVVKQAVKNGVICESDPVEFAVSEIVINPVIINNSGLAQFCPSSSATFTVDLGGVVADHITWSIKSSTSATNFGSITDGINSTTATVGFNEISTSPTGILQVDVIKCGQTFTQTYVINLIENPTLTIGTVANICPADTGTVAVPITITPSPPYPVSIKVLIDGVDEGTYSYSGGGTLNINNTFANSSSSNISRNLTLQLGVCNYSVSASQNVIVYPETEVYVSPSYSYIVCPATYGSISLTSTVSTGITSSTVFEWYKVPSTTPIAGANSENFSITGPNPGGTYYVKVIDQNGCEVRSDNIYVTESCAGGGPGGCIVSPNPNASASAQWTSCNTIITDLNYDYPPTSIVWTGSTHLSPAGGQTTDNATFTTTVPGTHVVTAYLNYSGCTIVKTYTVEKNYEAKMSPEITCNGDGTYKIVLYNHSLTYNAGSINPLTFEYFGPGVTAGASGNSTTINSIGPGTYVYTMKVNSPGSGTPECETTLTITLDPEPDPNFTLSPLSYCSDEVITLTAPGYDPSNIYEWVFNGTSYITSEENTLIQLPAGPNQFITLTVTTPYGCTYTSNPVFVNIYEADFNGGIINPLNADFCANNPTPLSFSGSLMPVDIIWMLGNQEVGTGLTYQPTQSGSYWPVLIDANGCKSYIMATEAKSYILRQPPFASISGNTSVCFDESTILVGITTDNAVEHRWSGPSLPSGYGTWVAGDTNKVLELTGLTPGTYNYTFETRAASDPSCTNSFTTTVEVHPQVPTPTISYTVINCDPYTIQLTATGPSTGVYNWSNGMTGTTIEVTHGGAYSVTYTETTGCSATGYIQAPHNPERALWVVPAGCYTVCDAYLIGPLGTYDSYSWEVNGSVTQSGNNTFIPNQPVTSGGTYQLFISQQGCTYGSNIPDITIDLERCPPKSCDFKVQFELMEIIPGGFVYYVQMTNPTSNPIAVHLSSYNGYGTFVPSVLVLNPGFNSFAVEFYVNGTYMPGVPDMFVVSGPGCADVVEVKLSETHWENLVEPASLALSPNPSYDTTVVTFSTGTEYDNAQSIKVYDIMGLQRYNERVSGQDGEITLDVSRFIPGTYIITLEADGKRIATEKLIKK
ncbi:MULTISPECIES: PKD domain-containing protein [unclassified Flavobacterium]|uniref:PKD domain-containing protein n=1 Tax=unclassified Flavobacterium TaxID=196869 RepID=UPI00234A46DA|nr:MULTISPECIES: PKD domain-containing protein [unclassified Flavobacterium]